MILAAMERGAGGGRGWGEESEFVTCIYLSLLLFFYYTV